MGPGVNTCGWGGGGAGERWPDEVVAAPVANGGGLVPTGTQVTPLPPPHPSSHSVHKWELHLAVFLLKIRRGKLLRGAKIVS
jgi:hypothetical protein